MKSPLKYQTRFDTFKVIETSSSPFNEVLEVCSESGKMLLNGKFVTLSFGQLDRVFRDAFEELRIGRRDIQDVLLLGLGAGNAAKILSDYDRNYRIIGVEIDGEVIRLARKYFDLDKYQGLNVVNMDALEYMAGCTEKFDLVIIDLFIDALVPEKAEQDAFLKRAAASLRPEGLLMFNRLMLDDNLSQQTKAFTRKMQRTLPGTQYLSVQKNRIIYYEK